MPLLDQLLNLEFQNAPNSTNNSLGLNDPTTGVVNPGLQLNDQGIDLAGLGSTLRGLSGLASAWAGLQGVSQGREQLRFQKALTNRNLANQAQTVNTQLADRQVRRLDASGGGQYQSVADYLRENRVQGGGII